MFSTCTKVNEWMSGFYGQWGIAGGWAIDVCIGKEMRPHSDFNTKSSIMKLIHFNNNKEALYYVIDCIGGDICFVCDF